MSAPTISAVDVKGTQLPGEQPPKDRPYPQRRPSLGVGPIFRRLLARHDVVGMHCFTVLTLTPIGNHPSDLILYDIKWIRTAIQWGMTRVSDAGVGSPDAFSSI